MAGEALVALGAFTFTIRDEPRARYPELGELVLGSESIEKNKRQYRFDKLTSMNGHQVDQLFKALVQERVRTDVLHINYHLEIASLDCKHAWQFVRLLEREKSRTLITKKKAELFLSCNVVEQTPAVSRFDDAAT